MRLTRQGDYAVRVVVDLASRPAGAVVPRSSIQERQAVPAAYLAKIVQALARAGLVRTHPGARGGVALARRADDITLKDVIEAVEGPIHLNQCVAPFLAVQGSEWVRLLHWGLTAVGSPYGGIVYALLGGHGVHVLAAVVWLLAVTPAGRRPLPPAHRLEACALYWYFVCALWLAIFALVYLA